MPYSIMLDAGHGGTQLRKKDNIIHPYIHIG